MGGPGAGGWARRSGAGLVVAIVALLVVAAPAAADTIIVSNSVALAPATWTATLPVAGFDPSVGTLVQVDIDLDAGLVGDFQFESTGPDPVTVTATLAADVTVERPGGGTTVLLAAPSVSRVDDLTAFDGVLDNDGTSGRTQLGAVATAITSVTLTAPTDLAAFVSAGTVGLPITATKTSAVVGLVEGSSTLPTSASAGLTVTYTWIPDTVAPGLPAFTTTPADPTNDTTPTWVFSIDADAVAECSVDGASFAGCTSPFTPTITTEGSHELAVEAIDPVGNRSGPATDAYILDLTPPVPPSFVSEPPNPTNAPTWVFALGGDAAGAECSVDGGPFVACSSPFTPALAGDGSVTIDVVAVDAAGNPSTPITSTVVVDTAAPGAPAFVTTPPTPANDTTPTWTFTPGTDAVGVECSLDGAPFVACSSPFEPTVTTDGDHTLALRSVDVAGNVSTALVASTIALDLVPGGVPAFTVEPANPTNDTTPTWEFTLDLGTTAECSVDGAAFGGCTSPFTPTVGLEGAHQLDVQSIDDVGNRSAPASSAYELDVTPPGPAAFLTEPASPTNDPAPTWTFSLGSGAATAECSVDGGAFSPCSSPFAPTLPAQGPNTLDVISVDLAGNLSVPITSTVVLDTVAPGPASFLTEAPSPTNDTTPTWTFAGGAGGSGVECSVNGDAFAACASPFTPTLSVDGPNTVTLETVDAAGNRSGPVSSTITLDTVVPGPAAFDSTPPTPTNDTTPTWTFHEDAGAVAVECSVDGGPFVLCASPLTPTLTGEGAHSVSIQSVDAAGNRSLLPVSSTIVLDTLAPGDPAFVTEPPSPTNDTTPTWTFSPGVGASGVECSVDGGAFVLCVSPFTPTIAGDGAHALEARSLDAAGNRSAPPVGSTIVLDTVPPGSAAFLITPVTPTNDTTPTWTFSAGVGASGVECSVDGGPFVLCVSPFTPTIAGEGLHILEIRSLDAAGNRSAPPVGSAIVLDTVAPGDPAFVTEPPSPTNDTTPTWTFSPGVGAVAVECSVDGGPFVVCASPLTPTIAGEGAHSVSIQSVDAAGNRSLLPLTSTIVLDTLAPADPAFVTEPVSPTNDTTPTWTFTAGVGAVAVECSVDGGAFVLCVSPFTPTIAGEGSHTLEIRSLDAAGNRSAPPVGSTIVLDTLAPGDPSFLVTPVTPTSDTSPTWTFSAGVGASGVECSVDGGPFVLCVSPFTPTIAGEGSHTLEIQSVDAAGNRSAPPVGSTIVLDTLVPGDPSFLVTPVTPTNDTTPTWTFSAGAGAAGVECSVDGGPFVLCVSPFTPTIAGEGSHTLEIRSLDAAGNRSAPPLSSTIVLDTVAPGPAVFLTTPVTPTNDTTPTWTFAAGAGASGVECSVDGGPFVLCVSPFTPTIAGEGSHTLEIRSLDAAGNRSAPPVGSTIVLDTLAPGQPSFLTTPPTPTNSTNPTWTFTPGAESVRSECSLDGAPFTTCTSPFQPTLPVQGPNTLELRAVDEAGNASAPISSTVVLDTIPPGLPAFVTTPPAQTNDTTPTWTFTPGTGASGVECSLDGGPFVLCASPFTPTVTAEGPHTLNLRSVDAAGNRSAPPVPSAYTLDLTPPGTPLFTGTPLSPGNDTTPTWAFSVEAEARAECVVDGAAAVICVSPFTPTVISQGNHTLVVTAVDPAGNRSLVPAASTIVLDTIPPADPTFLIVPPDRTNVPAVLWTFTVGSGGSGTECSVDGALFEPCSSSFLASPPFGDGTHSLTVRSVDTAGNVSPGITSTTIVDTTPPGAPDFLLTPVSPDNDDTPTWTFTVELDTFGLLRPTECTLDGGPVFSCASPFTAPALLDGSHTLVVRAIDRAGNRSADAVSTIVIDTVPPPRPVFTSEPRSPGRDSTPSWVYTIAVGASAACELDGASVTCPDGGFTAAVLSDGSHSFEVVAVDLAGNVSPPARSSIVIDTAPPAAPRLTPPRSPGNDATPTWGVSSTGGTTTCALDGGIALPCAASFTAPPLPDGNHTLAAVTSDAAGNVSGTARSTIVVDTTPPPVPVFTAVPPPATTDRTPTWSFIAPDGSPLTCRLDGGAPVACGGSLTAPRLNDGTHTLDVTATDPAGNSLSARSVVVVDTVAPATPINNRPPPPTSDDSTPTWGFVLDPGSAGECSVDGGPWFRCSPGITFGPLRPGQHTLLVRAVDAAGNTSGAIRAEYLLFVPPPAPPPAPGVQQAEERGTSAPTEEAAPPVDEGGGGPTGPRIPGETEVRGQSLNPSLPEQVLTEVVDRGTFPAFLLGVVLVFLVVQNRIDRRDPKLASPPQGAEPEYLNFE